MPVTYSIDRESARLHTRCVGKLTLDEVFDHFHQLEIDDTLPPQLDVLLDLTAMESLPEAGQLRMIATEVGRVQKSKLRWGACAIIADRDALYGMTRMFQVFAEDHFADSCVFREREEAERWIASRRSPTA